ncbi:class I SAM-dependent methyltransferase [Nitrospira sp. KM1]|uniref:class I SAM-dependent methyltransferase n=1 Tax=Nitrospira sp. KM1 TaxID=1936990 RepID=UPI0015649A60|nr:class I SAM-dependent methyltransferase [Nitrospira sp. KM1]
MAETLDDGGIKTGYDLWASSYDDEDPSTWLDEPFLMEQLKPFPGCRILDLGCGTGRYLRQLNSHRYRIAAIDLSRCMMARAQQDVCHREDIWWVQSSVTDLPFQPNSFDRVMSGLVLDHVASPSQFFDQVASALRRDGRAVVSGVHPDMQRLTGADIEVDTRLGAARIHGHIHEVKSLVEAAEGAGLRVEGIREPPISPAMVQRKPSWEWKLGCPALVLMALTR